jgi:hypothetical protein
VRTGAEEDESAVSEHCLAFASLAEKFEVVHVAAAWHTVLFA